MATIDIQVPDIGDFDEVTVIELMVKVGDTVKAEQSLITVESDKASMEIPSSHGGVVTAIKVALGDKVKLPIVVWGNGACANSPWEHVNFLSEVASHGFLIVAIGPMPAEGQRGGEDEEQRATHRRTLS